MKLKLDYMLNYYSNMSLPAKAAIWFTICNFVLKGISFITVPLFTRLLPSEEYGLLSVYTSYEQVILILATWEIQNGAYQKGLFKFKENTQLFTTSTQVLVNLLTVVFFVFVLIFRKSITKFTGMNGWILLFLLFYLLFQPSYTTWLTRRRTKYEYKSAVVVTIIYSLINVFIPLGAILLFNRTANFKFGATLLGSAVFCIFFYVKNADYSTFFDRYTEIREFWKFLISFEGPVVLHSLSYLILNQADRVMISKMVGNSEAAFYSVAYSLAVLISILQASINQSLLPWQYQMLEKRDYKKIRDINHGLLIGLAVIILMYILIAPELVRFLFEKTYYKAVWCIPPVASSIFFIFLYSIFVNVESYFEKTKYIMYISVICGVANIVLNYVCIQAFGYIACGYTTLVSYILFSLGHYYFMKKIMKENDVEENLVNPKLLLFVCLFVVTMTILFAILYNMIIVRYTIFLFGLFIMLLKRKNILRLIASIKKKDIKGT